MKTEWTTKPLKHACGVNRDTLGEDTPLNMLKGQIEAQGRAFEETGGFSERLTTRRLEAREQHKAPDAPDCPQCGKPMRRRTSAKGDFWGCSSYPGCKGTRPV